MPQYYTHVYLKSGINPKLTYPLAVSSVINKLLDAIQSRVHPEVTARKGYNYYWPKKYVAASTNSVEWEYKILK